MLNLVNVSLGQHPVPEPTAQAKFCYKIMRSRGGQRKPASSADTGSYSGLLRPLMSCASCFRTAESGGQSPEMRGSPALSCILFSMITLSPSQLLRPLIPRLLAFQLVLSSPPPPRKAASKQRVPGNPTTGDSD